MQLKNLDFTYAFSLEVDTKLEDLYVFRKINPDHSLCITQIQPVHASLYICNT